VTNTNSAFAFANCRGCTTVAVSFQVVLVVGQSNTIAPINAAGALNVDCPACTTVAVATQIVVTLTQQPSAELLAKLKAALAKLNALPALGADATPDEIVARTAAVQKTVEQVLNDSGITTAPVGSGGGTASQATATGTAAPSGSGTSPTDGGTAASTSAAPTGAGDSAASTSSAPTTSSAPQSTDTAAATTSP
jgi:putative peptide zinc metalloprotease protein